MPKPFGLGSVVIFQGFAVMERLGTPNKQKSILEYCSSPVTESLLSEEDVVKKRAAEAQKQQEAKAAREKTEQERFTYSQIPFLRIPRSAGAPPRSLRLAPTRGWRDQTSSRYHSLLPPNIMSTCER